MKPGANTELYRHSQEAQPYARDMAMRCYEQTQRANGAEIVHPVYGLVH